MSSHILTRFDNELDELNDMILNMFKLARRNIKQALKSLFSGGLENARSVIEQDAAVNALEVQIDELARRLIVAHQPAASDLRMIFAVIKIVTDLERISDLAVNIAEEVIRMNGNPLTEKCQIKVMQQMVLAQMKAARQSFLAHDVVAAKQIIEADSLLDDAYEAAQRVLLTHMIETPAMISRYMILANITKELERMGDHITNIAEMTIYLVIGHEVRHIDPARIQALIEEEDDD